VSTFAHAKSRPVSIDGPRARLPGVPMRLVITGAAGLIGSGMVDELSPAHDLRLLDRAPIRDRRALTADLARDRSRVRWSLGSGFHAAKWTETFEGAAAILHLAADRRVTAPWPAVLRDNIHATWNVIQAAVRYRVPRVVYASSHWAVKATERQLAPKCYRPDGPKITSDTTPKPLTPYGISKAIGEIAGHCAVDEGRLGSFVAVRIGAYPGRTPVGEDQTRLWIGAGDLRTLLRSCLEAPFDGFHVVYGVSGQPSAPFDLSHTRRLLAWNPSQRP
jgi:NAD+ dependent glucose-6-phosphate dehydrogenase